MGNPVSSRLSRVSDSSESERGMAWASAAEDSRLSFDWRLLTGDGVARTRTGE
jgi:hypothetical protein